ncbi:hypothetical protein KY284_021158 [Solanum tuberosum]|nr:hypothetical protein KY284_021158 [Solanum tuberosum]
MARTYYKIPSETTESSSIPVSKKASHSFEFGTSARISFSWFCFHGGRIAVASLLSLIAAPLKVILISLQAYLARNVLFLTI